MNNLDALTLPGCRPHWGQDAWYFPCGLAIFDREAQGDTDKFQPLQGAVHLILQSGSPNMLTAAHVRHHQDGHDETDRWDLFEYVDDIGEPESMTCTCLRDDTHWHFFPQLFHKHPQDGGML